MINLINYQSESYNSSDDFRQVYRFWSDSLKQEYLGIKYSKSILKEIKKKIESLIKYKSPTLLEIVGYGIYIQGTKESLMIITKYYNKVIPLSNILEVLLKKQKSISISATKCYIIAVGIAHGMKYLHSKKIYHSNLTPSEIFIDENYYPHIFYLNLDINSSDIDTTNIYSSSVLLEQKEYYQNDIYAYSIILYALLTHKDPHKVNINNPTKVLQGVGDEFTTFFTCSWGPEDIKDMAFENIYDWLLTKKVRKEFGDIEIEEVTKFLEFIKNNDETETPESQDDTEKPSKEAAKTEKNSKEKESGKDKDLQDETEKGKTKKESKEENSPSGSDVSLKDEKEKNRKSSKEDTKEDKSVNPKTNSDSIPNEGDDESKKKKKHKSNKGAESAAGDDDDADVAAAGDDEGDDESKKKKKHRSNKGAESTAGDDDDDESKKKKNHKSNKGADADDDTDVAAAGDDDGDDTEEIKNMFKKAKAFYEGIDGEVNFTEAAKYFKMAADKGYTKAMNWYGDMLRFGLGVEFDYDEALKYYKMSMKEGDKRGEKRYIALKNKIESMSTK